MTSDPALNGSRRNKALASAGVALLFAYLVSPAFTSTHVEAFSTQIQSLALALKEGWVHRHDIELPIVSQFIFTSRSGVIALLAGIDLLRGESGDLNFRLLTLASLLILIGSSCIFARRWGGASYTSALLAVTLVPGALQVGFYFNDNVVSAAFAALAVAVVGPRSRLSAFAVAGLLMAAAVQCRTDAILALPLVAGLAPLQRPTCRHVSLAALAFLSGFLPAVVLAASMAGFTPLHSWTVAQLFIPPEASRGIAGKITGLNQGIRFFGLVAGPLLALGAIVELRSLLARRSQAGSDPRWLWRLLLLIVYPAVLVSYAVWMASNMRYFYPLLTPLIALHGARGIQLLVTSLMGGGVRFAAALLFVITAGAIFIAPPLKIQVRDGPTPLIGDAYSPILWRHWQREQEQGMGRLAEVVADVRQRRNAVIVTTGHDEFYLRLRLFQAGYRSVDTATEFPGCAGFSTLKRGDARVIHLRLYPQAWRSPFSDPESAALLLSTAHSCPAVGAAPDMWLLAFGTGTAGWLQLPEFAPSRSGLMLDVPVAPVVAAARSMFLGSDKDPFDEDLPVIPVLGAVRMPQAKLSAAAAQAGAKLGSASTGGARRDEMLNAYYAAYRPLPVGSRRW